MFVLIERKLEVVVSEASSVQEMIKLAAKYGAKLTVNMQMNNNHNDNYNIQNLNILNNYYFSEVGPKLAIEDGVNSIRKNVVAMEEKKQDNNFSEDEMKFFRKFIKVWKRGFEDDDPIQIPPEKECTMHFLRDVQEDSPFWPIKKKFETIHFLKDSKTSTVKRVKSKEGSVVKLMGDIEIKFDLIQNFRVQFGEGNFFLFSFFF